MQAGVEAGGDDDQPLNRIQIVVRVRPVLPHEATQQVAVTCSSDGSSVQVMLPEWEFSKPAIAASSKPDAKAYEFDACLTGSTTQAELYDVCGISELVDAALDGYNVTVFAFGQTGSGKTYTIIGPGMAGMQGFEDSPADATAAATPTSSTPEPGAIPPAQQATAGADADGPKMQQEAGSSSRCSSGASAARPQQQQQQHPQQLSEHEGLLARCVQHLYDSIGARRDAVQCSVAISCTEVYNETVTDMLGSNNNQQLQVRQDPRTEAFYVDGLTQVPAQTPNKALRVLSEALAYRHTRAHKLNSYSSRSHCMVTLTLTSQDVGDQGQELLSGVKGGMRRCGKLVLVDLAGSERLNSTGSNGARESLKETGAINKSLFTLGQVLAALSVRGGVGGNSHVPYRDSRLTQLLWEGLRGGGRVLMLACLCPLKFAAEESLNTLHFASMALRIKSTPVIMMDPQDHQMNEMRTMIKTLQEDCKSLASALTQICTAGPGADVSTVLQTLPPNLVQDALRYGSSSAPALDQQLRQHSPSKGQRTSRGGLRASGSSLGRPKAIYVSKPATADPALCHSMPALPYHTNSSGPGSPVRSPNSKQHARASRQSSPWYSSSMDLLPALGNQGRNNSWAAGGNGPGWNMYGSPPRSSGTPGGGGGKSNAAGRLAGTAAAGRALDGAGSNSLGPSTGSKLYPGSLRQELYQAGASGLNGVLSGVAQGPVQKPSWVFNSRYDTSGPRTSQLVEAPVAGSNARRSQEAGGGLSAVNSSYQAGICGLPGPANSSRRPHEPQLPRLDDFPELAALEQQFRMQQQQPQVLQDPSGQQQAGSPAGSPGKPFDVQLLGNTGVLLPSGLPASIRDPHSLVPVRIGVADSECLGTSPDASPVAVALAAAHSQVRPIAVPLPADLTRAAAAAAGGPDVAQDTQGAEGGGGAPQPDPQALTWAQRNMWFGSDEAMTRLAYEVHDMLVGEQGVDPSSPLYYTAIESHVAAAFPDKWAHWQQLLAAAGAQPGAKGRGSTLPAATQQQPAYVSYKLPLKTPVPRFSPGNSPPRQGTQQQQQQVAGGPWGDGTRLPEGSPTLSQLLQHPVLGAQVSPSQQQQQQQQQQAQQQAVGPWQLLDKSLPQQLLQQYQQEHPQLMLQQYQQEHPQLMLQQLQAQQQQMQAQIPALQSGVGQQASTLQGDSQQQQQQHGSLPELRHSESPLPPADDSQQQGSPGGAIDGAAAAAGGAMGLGILAGNNPLTFRSSNTAGQTQRKPRKPSPQQQQQQQQADAAGLSASKSNLGGISAAASRVLEASTPSFYDGAGPLTSGSKPAWTSSNQGRSVQAGQDLAQVLRSGLNPGNKSLAEMQAEYKQARALVLDRLRQQKEAAEAQRKQILLQLGRAISNSAWRA